MTSLRADRLTLALGRRVVLRDASVAMTGGSFTVVVGPNGAGKTTLLKALAGLLPAGAAVTLDGRPLSALPMGERARAIAYLAQGGSVAWAIPVRDVVALGRLPHGERPERLSDEGRHAVAEALAAVGLDGFEDRPATELSGGERARVLLARALATQAPVLLADEPVAALDPRHQLAVLDVLRRRARAGAAVVAVMHDLSLAARFADTICLLEAGRVVAAGLPNAVLTEGQLAASFGIVARVTRMDGALLVVPERPLPGAPDA